MTNHPCIDQERHKMQKDINENWPTDGKQRPLGDNVGGGHNFLESRKSAHYIQYKSARNKYSQNNARKISYMLQIKYMR